jgi:hypothetical protein
MKPAPFREERPRFSAHLSIMEFARDTAERAERQDCPLVAKCARELYRHHRYMLCRALNAVEREKLFNVHVERLRVVRGN